MKVTASPDLHKQNRSSKMINNLLIALPIPPLNGEVSFSTSVDEPERPFISKHLRKRGHEVPFFLGKMYISLKLRRSDPGPKLFVQKLLEPVDIVEGAFVTLRNQRRLAVDDSGLWKVLANEA
jgi:hypothetical protein